MPAPRSSVRVPIWHLAQLGDEAVLGASCVVGRGAYVGPGVRVGDSEDPELRARGAATLESGVFVGPAVVLTNDLHPRSVDVDGEIKSAVAPVGVFVKEGASLGARRSASPR